MHTAASAGGRLTYDDLMQLPDDGKRHELIDGVHYVTPSPFTPHQRVVGNLYYLLRQHLEAQPTGQVFLSPLDIVLSMFDVVAPDIFYVSAARMSILTAKHVHGAPDLVVEVVSSATRRRDEGVKRALYNRVGVREYWLVDPSSRRIRVFRRGTSGLVPAESLAEGDGDVLTSALLPDMRLRLARVFER